MVLLEGRKAGRRSPDKLTRSTVTTFAVSLRNLQSWCVGMFQCLSLMSGDDVHTLNKKEAKEGT